jgi:hypothetical protein
MCSATLWIRDEWTPAIPVVVYREWRRVQHDVGVRDQRRKHALDECAVRWCVGKTVAEIEARGDVFARQPRWQHRRGPRGEAPEQRERLHVPHGRVVRPVRPEQLVHHRRVQDVRAADAPLAHRRSHEPLLERARAALFLRRFRGLANASG